MSQNKDDDFLADLEADIGGDWKEIQKSIQNKEDEEEYKKLKANPQRINFPKFRQFYEVLLDIFREGIPENRNLHRLLVSIFHNHRNEDPMPKAFDKVWEIFCNPHKYRCATGVACKNCRNRWDVMYRNEQVRIRSYPRFIEDRIMQEEMYLPHTQVACPSCGCVILNITSSEVSGVFKHVHVDEREEHRPNRSYMGERGYDRFIN